jgi:carbamoyltransferase
VITLGINAAFHDSSAALVDDGIVIAAAEEERFTHVKHAKRPVPFSAWELPFHAIDYCLREAGKSLADVDHVAYAYQPELAREAEAGAATITLPMVPPIKSDADSASPWDPLFECFLMNARGQLVDGAPHHLRRRFETGPGGFKFQWHYVEHHLAHEASAFLAAPFDACAVLTLDGRGEHASTSFGRFDQSGYERLGQIELPSSLGLLYEEVTDFLGFLRSSDEYKVMALASYGTPAYAQVFREIVHSLGEGRYRVHTPDLVRRLGPPRKRGDPVTQRELDIARSAQLVLEETVIDMAAWLRRATQLPNLAMAGGVALNCVMNARIRDSGHFEHVWVQPAAGDAGTALGAALWIVSIY